MTWVDYDTNIKEMRPLGRISIALTDSQATYSDDGTTNDHAQKLFYKNGTLSFGAGSSTAILAQSKLIGEKESKIDSEMIEGTIFPELIESHYKSSKLDDLMEVDEREIIQLMCTDSQFRDRFQKSMTNTYIISNSDDVHEGFELSLNGSFYPPNTNEVEKFNRPSVTKVEARSDGSGLHTLSLQNQVVKNMDRSDLVEIELDSEFEVLAPMYSLLNKATTAAKSPGVNDKFQIGIMNDDQVSLLYHPDVSFETKSDNLEYINNVLNTNIGLDDEVDFIHARLLVDIISNEFFNKYREIDKTHLALQNKVQNNILNRRKIDTGTLSEVNGIFISKLESFDKYLLHFIEGNTYKIIDGRTKEGKKIGALQEKYPGEKFTKEITLESRILNQ